MAVSGKHLALALLVGGVGAVRLCALEWVSERFVGATRPLQSTLDVAFGFKNTSDRPVSIRAVQTNCDCLAAGPNKLTYAPGEAGVITARFTVGDRYGPYERVITVQTDDGAEPKRLIVQVEVPEPATTSPTILMWSIGSAADEKTIELRTAAGVHLDFAEVFPSTPDFRVRLETVTAGQHFRLHVAPVRTSAPANAALRAKGTTPDGQVVVISAYANVR